jgi:DNA-binding response OmpR family regulator
MKSILIADDDKVSCHLLRGVFKAAGFAVSTVPDGRAALRQLKKKPVDLMILDIWMPRINGLEVLALLRNEPKAPRVIVMTADGTPATMLQAIREHAYHYVTKPIDPVALVEMVRDALSRKPLAPPVEVISGRTNWVELLVPCEMGVVDRIEAVLLRLEADLSPTVRGNMIQAFRELLNNAIEWGGHLDPNLKVRISYVRAEKMVMYRIADPGTGFKFEGLTHAAINNPEDNPIGHLQARQDMGLRPGGLGLLLTKSLVDELVYNEAQNEVVCVKYLE